MLEQVVLLLSAAELSTNLATLKKKKQTNKNF